MRTVKITVKLDGNPIVWSEANDMRQARWIAEQIAEDLGAEPERIEVVYKRTGESA